MAGVLMPTARYVQLIATGEYHDGIEVVEPRDVTLYVESPKSAWDKKQGIAAAEIEQLKQRIAQLEAKPVIDESAAKRIATSLGWEPKRERVLFPTMLRKMWSAVKCKSGSTKT